MLMGGQIKKIHSICKFLVNNFKETVFLYSLDTSNILKAIDKVLDDVSKFVEKENVVQVFNDNSGNFKVAKDY